jgi:hypothetical protein
MITMPTIIGMVINRALSRFLKRATIPVMNPARPKAAIAKVGRGKKPRIFIAIKTIKAELSPIAHLPESVFGRIFIYLCNSLYCIPG